MARKARLHWFWRGAIAIALYAGCQLAIGMLNHEFPGNLIWWWFCIIADYHVNSPVWQASVAILMFNIPVAIGSRAPT